VLWAQFLGIFQRLKQSEQQRVGTLTKEEQTGKTIADYKSALAAAGHTFESVDIAVALGAVMAIKDEEEMVFWFFFTLSSEDADVGHHDRKSFVQRRIFATPSLRITSSLNWN
jgi:nucleosome binding factor SPN SPT16 subunit